MLVMENELAGITLESRLCICDGSVATLFDVSLSASFLFGMPFLFSALVLVVHLSSSPLRLRTSPFVTIESSPKKLADGAFVFEVTFVVRMLGLK